MKIGIVRHFKVDYKHKKIMDSNDFEKYITSYDNAEVIENKININCDDWDKCYCSDLARTIKTAESIYGESLENTELLREVTMYPLIKSQLKIPSFIWSISSRIAWKINHKSQLEAINDTSERAKSFLNKLDVNKSENILIVSHGFFLITLIKELKELGFKGKIPKKIKNGYLYILQN
ncbi:histidine phosphatase family protein [Clostridium gasigenes]|uniref:Histidine phosphatase family protein n=1 Tax=Clostridium gasigenes TaxID=94869 RepID=A0A7X0S922_9CLOT|nr:histidine phosphatase family protein [Clostridium gasigenes]MBB6713301.1 histidine phosphatase family protein [Clostridium gasigenes]